MKLRTELARIAAVLFAAVFLAVNCHAESTGSSGSDSAIKPQKVYELVTSNNPDYYCKITINRQSITVTGKFTPDVVEVTMKNCGTVSSTLRKETDGSFTAILNPQSPIGGSDSIVITLSSGVTLPYRIEYSNGWYFPDNRLSEHNSEVVANAISTSPKAWASYLTDELTEESVKSTLDTVQNLSDYIAGDIKNDYDKMTAIARWVSENIYYDRDARDSSVTTSTICIKNVIRDRHTVCGGYANLYCALLEAQGINAVNIKGTVTTNDNTVTYENLSEGRVNHEWCAVELDGRWITMDVGWNSGNYYENGEFYKRNCYEKYTDPTDLALSLDHCAYLAEKRYYFRAGEYFESLNSEISEQTQSTTPDSSANSDNSDNSDSSDSSSESITPDESSQSIAADTSAVPSSPESITDSSNMGSDSAPQEESGGSDIVIWIIVLGVIIVILVAVDIANVVLMRKNKK